MRILALGNSICCVCYEGLRLWEAHLYVFYVSGRLSGGRPSNEAKTAGGSVQEKSFTGVGGGCGREWGTGSVVFYEGLRLWEAHLHVFYESWRLSRGRMSNEAKIPGGSAKERPSRAWGGGGGERDSICCVLRGSEGLGSSFACVFRVWEALGVVGRLTKLWHQVSPLNKDPRGRGGVEALGGSDV